MKYCRYLLVENGAGQNGQRIKFTAPTIDEVFQQLKDYRSSRSVRESGCYYQYVGTHELVDLWEDPGHIDVQEYWSYWVPGRSHPDEDHTSLRFKNMELE